MANDSTTGGTGALPGDDVGRGKKRRGAKAAASTGTGTPSHVQPRRAERRPEMIRQRRQERKQAYERRQREWLITRVVAGAIGVVAIAIIGIWGFGQIQDWRDQRAIADDVQVFEDEHVTRDHTANPMDPVDYAHTPPVGGTHSGIWQNCDFYDEPIRDEHAVHSLEHGAVWITYHPDLPDDQVDLLRQRAEDQTYILVSPYPDLQAPVIATAWGHQLELESARDDRLDTFINTYRLGPQTPEPGAVCHGGTSATA